MAKGASTSVLACFIAASNSVNRNGLGTTGKALCPERIQSGKSSIIPVTSTTGVAGQVLRAASTTTSPCLPPRRKSVTTISNASVFNFEMASSAELTVVTAKPAQTRSCFVADKISGSSSTNKILGSKLNRVGPNPNRDASRKFRFITGSLLPGLHLEASESYSHFIRRYSAMTCVGICA